tara:strand:- start:1461 stop:2027 length:567 start_codon:yes stop_codon:yes gene_type:complete
MEAATAISVASTLKAGMSIMHGNAQATQLAANAQQTIIRARSDIIRSRVEALKHKKDANTALEKLNRTLATVTAYAGQTLDPFSGSVGAIATNIMKKGYNDYSMKKDSATMEQENQAVIKYSAEYQATNYRKAATRARNAGYLSAAIDLASGYAMSTKFGTGSVKGAQKFGFNSNPSSGPYLGFGEFR